MRTQEISVRLTEIVEELQGDVVPVVVDPGLKGGGGRVSFYPVVLEQVRMLVHDELGRVLPRLLGQGEDSLTVQLVRDQPGII